MKQKICKKCSKELPLDAFAKGKCPNGRHYWCRKCVSAYGQKWRKENSTHDKERNAAWHVANAEKVRLRKMEWYEAKKRAERGE